MLNVVVLIDADSLVLWGIQTFFIFISTISFYFSVKNPHKPREEPQTKTAFISQYLPNMPSSIMGVVVLIEMA